MLLEILGRQEMLWQYLLDIVLWWWGQKAAVPWEIRSIDIGDHAGTVERPIHGNIVGVQKVLSLAMSGVMR
jgi:hypothetical protein